MGIIALNNLHNWPKWKNYFYYNLVCTPLKFLLWGRGGLNLQPNFQKGGDLTGPPNPMGHPPPHLKMKQPPSEKFPPLKRQIPFHKMIPRKSTINNNLNSS